jgi:phosphoribosylformylglycinamidine synthase
MAGTKRGYDAPTLEADSEGELLLVGDGGLAGGDPALGGSQYLASHGGTDQFPTLPDDPTEFVETLATVADEDSTLAVHDISHGGLAVALAEMVTDSAGLDVELPGDDPAGECFHEQPGRVVIQTTAPEVVKDAFEGVSPVTAIGSATSDGRLSLTVGDTTIDRTIEEITDTRATITDALE